MATRFKTNSKKKLGQQPLPSGYETTQGTVDLHIPPCSVEDVDVALFNLFDKEIAPLCGGTDSTPLKKVPIIFAAGEKWSLLKNGRPLRDRNNTLLLPLITIMRTEVSQAPAEDIVGRGINQHVGEIVIRRRLDKSDRDYQSLINKLFLKGQDNLATPHSGSVERFTTGREIGQLLTTNGLTGALLEPNLGNNIFETIAVPTPQFYTAKYQITVWTQYMQHANQIMEKIITSFLPQGQSWKLESPKGYWFIASVDGGAYPMETNFDDMSSQERFIKHTFNVNVPAYFFVTDTPGAPVPIKRYVSSPVIKFEAVTASPSEVGSSTRENSYELGSDDPTLPLDTQRNNRKDQRTPGWRLQKIYPVYPSGYLSDVSDPVVQDDPAAATLPRGHSIVKMVNTAPNGETVYSGYSLGDLEIIVTKI